MIDFGERLRKERESRGVSLREMAEATKIGKRYLEALERNEFDALPGTVFAKGYIRNYAEHLGLDPEPLLEDYQRELRSRGGGADEEEAAQGAAQAVLSNLAASRGVSTAPRRTGWIVGAALLAGLLIAVLAWIFLGPSGAEPTDRAEKAAPSREEPAPVTWPAVTPEPAASRPEMDDAEPSGESRPEPEQEEDLVPVGAEPEPQPAPPAPAPRREPEPEETSPVVAAPGQDPPPKSPAAQPAAASRLSVPDYGVGTGIVDRQLAGRGDRFSEGTVVWFWTRVLGGRPGDVIRHVWIHEGRPQGTVELNVGGSHWRTQSRWSTRAGSAGAWAVEARDAEGRTLARAEFTCVPAD
jgi:cytoskeletal protein RodZ